MTHRTEPHDPARRLQRELADAVMIERATGVVMHRASLTADEALRQLDRDAATAHRSLARHCSIVLADAARPALPRAPAPPTRHHLVTTDPELARDELATAYRTPIRMTAPGPGAVFRLHHTDARLFQTGALKLPGSLSCVSQPVPQIVVGHLLGGTVRRDSPAGEQCLAASDVFLSGNPATVHAATTDDAQLHTVTLPLSLLHKVAGQLPEEAAPLGFTALHAASGAPADQWRATAAYTAALLDRPDPATGLVLANAAQLLAATALAVFPNTAVASPDAPHDRTDATSVTVRRAAAFIDEHADRDITLADIAAAACVTPRALQYAFRRHLGTTPLAHLRDVRLRRAHRDLLDADPALTTVTQVAARWGFLHPGRFASRYQACYHCPPSDTLHA